jgi:hypothetical protein
MKSGASFERIAVTIIHFDMRQKRVTCPNKTIRQAAYTGE